MSEIDKLKSYKTDDHLVDCNKSFTTTLSPPRNVGSLTVYTISRRFAV